jgi:hypothetical protein
VIRDHVIVNRGNRKGVSMKIKLLGLTVASVLLLSLIYYGCAGVERESRGPATSVPLASSRDIATTVTITRPPCNYSYTPDPSDPDRKPKKGSLNVTPPCTKFESPNDEIYVSDTKAPGREKKVLSIGNIEFITDGSCRYCYINSSGGMSCVVYGTASC